MNNFWTRENLINKFVEKNSQINLSAIRNAEDIFVKHIQDSLKLNEYFDLSWKKIVDIWTWSWFPLLPLAISNPTSNFTWIESIRKKVDAVNDMAQTLWVENMKVIWSRAEDHKEIYDILTARAVGYIDKLMDYGYHLVKKWWYFILYKMYAEGEYNDIVKVSKKYNIEIQNKYEYKLFEDDITRVIYIIRKK